MTEQEQYQWKLIQKHLEQMEYHKRMASSLLNGLYAFYGKEKAVEYQNESLFNLAQSLN